MGVQRVVLSSIDQLMPTSYIRLFLVVQTQQTNFDAAVQQLQHGLTRTQQQLPYIGGTLFETSCGEIGIEWEETKHPLLIQVVPRPKGFPSSIQLENAEYPFDEVWRVSSPAGRFGKVEVGEGLPAVIVTCSQLDGYIVLGVSCFHNLWDIAGLSVFLHLWSRNTRNSLDKVNLHLIEDISRRDDRLRRSLGARDGKHSTDFISSLDASSASNSTSVESCTLQFDIPKLKALGSRLLLESGKNVSTNDLATAIIWTAISSARASSENGSLRSPRLRMLVDGRRYVFPPKELKIPYMGNLALPLFSSLNNNQVSEGTPRQEFASLLAAGVGAILSSFEQASASPFVDAISAIDEASNCSAIRETSASYNSHQLTSTSWSQAPMYVDFGDRVGKVEYVRVAPDDYKLEGMILTMPRKRDGSYSPNCLEIFVALDANELQALRANEMVQSVTFVRPRSDANKAVQAKI